MSSVDTVHSLRAQLEPLLQSPDPYAFLTVVEDYLLAVPGDDPIRASAMGMLVQKGLLSVAAELARGSPANSPNGAELRRAGERLARMQRDLIDPATTDAQFAANLAVLRGRKEMHGELADGIERAWREECGDITLHRANDGNLLARASASGGRRVWVPAALDFANHVEVLQGHEAWKGNMMPPFLVAGVGGGWLIPRLHAATQGLYLTYSPAIYVVERNLRALAVVLRLHDWTAVLSDERVYVLGGPAAWEQWKDLLRGDPRLSPPSGVTSLQAWPGSPPSPAASAAQEMVRERAAACEAVAERVSAVYERCDRAYWAKRYASAGGDDPLRVLAVTCRFTTFLKYSTQDLLAAFERAGARTRLLIEPHDHALTSRKTVLEAFAEFRPDLVVVLDHHRHEMPERYARNVPYVCWIQDELVALFQPGVGSAMHELDFTIGYGRTRCVLKCGYPLERFMPCRLAVDLGKFAAESGEAVDPALRCDVAYVSNQSETVEAMHQWLSGGINHPQVRALMNAFYDQTRELMRSPRFNGAYDLDELMRQVEVKAKLICQDAALRDRLMSVYVRPLADRAIRHATVEWIADWADAAGRVLHLWGLGWENHPRFARYARGVAEHGRHLGRIARHAAINLHCGTSSALHQRVLETVGAGGFLMVRLHPQDSPLPEYESFRRYLIEHDVREPTRIPLGDLPAGWVASLRRQNASMGRPAPDFMEITPEYLLELDPRGGEDWRFRFAALAFPGFEAITFDGPESFAQRAEHFLAHPEEREAIVRRMQASVRDLFTYDALAGRIISFVHRRLER